MDNSASEVVREALRLPERHERTRAAQLKRLQTELDHRLTSLDRGEAANREEFFAELKSEEAQLPRTRKRR
jgi:Arc/MetJ-type ribon-helix-helix transcriptional regulator